jgi:hypothetical protein
MTNDGLVHYLEEKGIAVYENRLEKILRLLLAEPDKGTKWFWWERKILATSGRGRHCQV